MIPHRQPSDGAELFQAVSNEGETDKPLIGVMKLPAVSLFHRFQGEAAGNFQIGGPIPIKIKTSRALFAKVVKRRNSGQFRLNCQ